MKRLPKEGNGAVVRVQSTGDRIFAPRLRASLRSIDGRRNQRW
jgi:hypothetical protein